jgi:broad specificity phosphatase PhoE
VITLEDAFQLRILNDVQHVPVVTGNEPGIPVTLIRHGESEANRAGRWHGRTDGPLTEKGRHQGADLAARYNGITRVFSSPLQRTRLTAEAFAAPFGLSVEFDDDLVEIDFGAWEGMTTSEIGESHPDEWAAVFADGVDLARGGTGETFAEAGARMERAVRRLVEDHPTERLALFTHGGAIWSLVSRIIGIDWSRWRRVGLPGNASLTHSRLEGGSPVLIDYNLPA